MHLWGKTCFCHQRANSLIGIDRAGFTVNTDLFIIIIRLNQHSLAINGESGTNGIFWGDTVQCLSVDYALSLFGRKGERTVVLTGDSPLEAEAEMDQRVVKSGVEKTGGGSEGGEAVIVKAGLILNDSISSSTGIVIETVGSLKFEQIAYTLPAFFVNSVNVLISSTTTASELTLSHCSFAKQTDFGTAVSFSLVASSSGKVIVDDVSFSNFEFSVSLFALSQTAETKNNCFLRKSLTPSYIISTEKNSIFYDGKRESAEGSSQANEADSQQLPSEQTKTTLLEDKSEHLVKKFGGEHKAKRKCDETTQKLASLLNQSSSSSSTSSSFSSSKNTDCLKCDGEKRDEKADMEQDGMPAGGAFDGEELGEVQGDSTSHLNFVDEPFNVRMDEEEHKDGCTLSHHPQSDGSTEQMRSTEKS
ncbi:uncharacterized protein MONOS_15479 [Monocercomonoides exilis]|uniref:uncharacterized protein n=1 Tax=Monocercomonoides exilis TaxID=2049356 RepID=UPI00355A732B|nr:hypothetical protein MONOS_15479 [Monocercomonoides exilis]|eukprot:MONOS_15479.1-p1 / transcript=MONOS_15479.1 / gene=MONOS_15479 / organism=Monocercomonoides_exilis_PA203 / gene_product=unspecified product / transcript_product=unspecified product / location=Mono_scaffold01244:4536-6197(-) / protein_length=418 / sequence_SO=supercontig / SO=protein_coding / is_pseudo=false